MITKEQAQKKLQDWQKEKQILAIEQQIKQQKKEFKKAKKEKLTTTKFLMFFLFISCSIIQIFTLYITLRTLNMGIMPDLGPLQMLITAVVGEVIAFAIYSLKATKQNTKGGIIYQTAMNKQQQEFYLESNQQEAKG